MCCNKIYDKFNIIAVKMIWPWLFFYLLSFAVLCKFCFCVATFHLHYPCTSVSFSFVFLVGIVKKWTQCCGNICKTNGCIVIVFVFLWRWPTYIDWSEAPMWSFPIRIFCTIDTLAWSNQTFTVFVYSRILESFRVWWFRLQILVSCCKKWKLWFVWHILRARDGLLVHKMSTWWNCAYMYKT